MSFVSAVVLGLVQGFTEFLPISSSGHLILVQRLFGLTPDLFTAVAMHFGTLVAVVIFYRKKIWSIVKNPLSPLCLKLVLATLPTVVLGILAKLFAENWLEGALLPIGFALTVIVLILPEFFSKNRDNLLSMKYPSAFVCGVAQGISVLPGLSRSGTTVCALKCMGVKTESAFEFSFLLSIPVILGSVILTLPEAIASPTPPDILATLAGTVVSGVSGYFSLFWLKKLSQSKNLRGFAYYMIFPFLLACITA